MYQSSTSSRGESPVSVIGAGIAGAWQALLFAKAGHPVTLFERGDAGMTEATSHWAGGMLAPYCEREASEPVISRLGIRSLDLWRDAFPDTPFNGSLGVSPPPAKAVTELEPSLDGRFRDALFFPDEGHVEPRAVLPEMHARIAAAGGM